MYENIQTTRKDYRNTLSRWDLVDVVCDGSEAIKAAGTKYLPKPNPDDSSDANAKRYKQYVMRAVFFGGTKKTLQGMIGTAFKKSPMIALGTRTEYLKEDADGAGVGLVQMAQSTTSEVLKKGRHVLFVDYPLTDKEVKINQMDDMRATIIARDAKQVVNWKIEKVGSQYKYTLVVIKEEAESKVDEFLSETITQYRVLRLVNNRYEVTIIKIGSKGEGELADGPFYPKKADGSFWSEIPIVFVGSVNNDDTIDDAPLYELAIVNVAHYRNSADYEDSVFFTGQAQPWISGLDEEWRNHLESKGIYIGSRTAILLPENGAMGFAQAQPNTLAKEAMDQKEKQMIALGARLIQQGQAVKTATEAQGDQESNTSVLSLVVTNVSNAYSKLVSWAAEFMGDNTECKFEIDTDFNFSSLDAQTLTALVGAWQSNLIPTSDALAKLKRHGFIDPQKTDEEIKEELGNEPNGLNLDEPDKPDLDKAKSDGLEDE